MTPVKRKLTEAQVLEIKALAATKMKRVDISKIYGVSPQLISRIIRYGYNPRPRYEEFYIKPRIAPQTWEYTAAQFTEQNPDDPMTGKAARRIHDKALRKVAAYFKILNLDKNDLV